jgi:hypothetical protein
MHRMGTLDIKGKTPVMPKDLDDKKLADLFKKLDKQMAEWPAAVKAAKTAAGDLLGALAEIGGLAAEKAKDKKATPEQKAAYQKAYEATYAFGKQFNDMM